MIDDIGGHRFVLDLFAETTDAKAWRQWVKDLGGAMAKRVMDDGLLLVAEAKTAEQQLQTMASVQEMVKAALAGPPRSKTAKEAVALAKRVLMRIKWTHVGAGSSDPRGVLSSNDAYIRGLVRITGYVNPRWVDAEVITPVENTTTYNWSEGAWSTVQGFPRVIELHQARVVMGASTLKPHTVWGSAVDDYENFYPGLAADEAFRHTVAIGERDPILWLVSERFLLIGTGSGEWIMHGEDEEKAIIPEYGVAKRHSSYGSHNGGVPACFADSVSLFVQRGGTKIREFSYRFEADRYEAANLNLLADHLFISAVEDIAVQRMPWQVVWFVSAGKLYGMTYERAQNVAAWHRHETQGDILSAGSIRATGTEDQVWFLVNRGQGSIFIERFRQRHMDARPDDGWWQDSAMAVTFPYNFGAVAHLDGLTVTGHAQRQGYGPTPYTTGGDWPFVTGHIMGFALHPPGIGELIVELLWKDAGRRNGKPWFELVSDPTFFIQWTTHLETPRWQIFRDGLVVLESEENTEQPHEVTAWTVTEQGAAIPIDRPEFRASPLMLPPNAWGPIQVTGVSVPNISGIDLLPVEPGSSMGLFYRAETASHVISLFYVPAGGGTWRLRVETVAGALVCEFRSGSDVVNPFDASGWALQSGSATGLPLLLATLTGVDTTIVGLPYRWTVSPMTPDVPLANGPSRSREARVMRVSLSLKDSRGGHIGEALDRQLDPIGKGSASETFTGEHEISFEGGHSVDVPLVITGEEPYPFALRALCFKMNAFGDAS